MASVVAEVIEAEEELDGGVVGDEAADGKEWGKRCGLFGAVVDDVAWEGGH